MSNTTQYVYDSLEKNTYEGNYKILIKDSQKWTVYEYVCFEDLIA